jgi:hypothetical protein
MRVFAALLFGLAGVGSGWATEQPDYKLLAKDGKFEIREYPSLSVVRTASGDGDFMRLFRYISGDNVAEQKIAMTSPVLVQHEGEKTGMSFILPREVAAAGVPDPQDEAVAVDTLEARRFAVYRFSGGRNQRNEDRATMALAGWLAKSQLIPSGPPVFAYYDPPWIPTFLRRNEVMLEVAGSQP